MRADVVLECGNRLGEGPVWDDRGGALYWVDITGCAVHRFDPARGEHRQWPTGEHVGSLGLRESGGLVLALKNGFATLDLESGEVRRIVEVEADRPDSRFNDGRCDRAGRLSRAPSPTPRTGRRERSTASGSMATSHRC